MISIDSEGEQLAVRLRAAESERGACWVRDDGKESRAEGETLLYFFTHSPSSERSAVCAYIALPWHRPPTRKITH